MIHISVDKEYSAPEDWHEVTLKRAIESTKVAALIPKKLYAKHFTDKPVEFTDEDIMEAAMFYRKWVAFWFDIPENIAGQLSATDKDDEFGLITIYKVHLTKFLYAPSRYQPVQSFEHKGITYSLPISDSKPMKEGSFNEWVNGVLFKEQFDKLERMDFTGLAKLTAMLYRPLKKKGFLKGYEVEPFNDDTLPEREKIFMDITMDKIWSAYFFLIMWSDTFIRDTKKVYSRKPQERKVMYTKKLLTV